jgi:hypothetical protein
MDARGRDYRYISLEAPALAFRLIIECRSPLAAAHREAIGSGGGCGRNTLNSKRKRCLEIFPDNGQLPR